MLCVVAMLSLTLPAQAAHTASDVWDVDPSAYADDSDCTAAVRHCATIGAAIAAASSGDEIRVAPGTYTENLFIDKRLDVYGAQVNVDPRSSEGGRTGDESVIVSNGTAVTITGTNFARFNGFTIESHIDDETLPVILVHETSIPTVAYNIIHNVDMGAESGDAIRLDDTLETGFTVAHNLIHDMPGPGAGISAHTTFAANISFNEIVDIETEAGAVYVTDPNEFVVRANRINEVQGPGIVIGNHSGQDILVDMAPARGHVLDNTITNTTQQSILIQMSDINVLRNLVQDSTSDAGAIHLRALVPRSDIMQDLSLENVRVEGNCVFDNKIGIFAANTVDAFSLRVHQNNIVGNTMFGVASQTFDPINATHNWWGDASGPSGEGPGSGDAVSEGVIFEPWLTEPALGTACTEPPECRGPEEVDARSRNDGDIEVDWSAVSGADGYNVYRAVGHDGFSLLATVDGNTTDYTDEDTETAQTHRYQVTAVIDGEETQACETASATAIPVFPTIVAGLLAALIGVGAYVAISRRRR